MICAAEKYSLLESSGNAFSSDTAVLESKNPVRPRAAKGIRRIVIPLDGTPEAEHALPYAIAIARRSGSSICLVHVLPLKEAVDAWEESYDEGISELRRRFKHRYMSALVNRVRSTLGGKVSDEVIEDVDIAGTISKMTDENTLVIMAKRSKSFIRELIYGSITDDVIRKVKGPLLLVRGSASPPDLSSDPIPRHIMIPLNGKKCAEYAIAPAMQLGGLADARYTLVHLRDALVHRREITASQGYLKSVASRFTRRDAHFDTEVLVSYQDMTADLLDLTEMESADWIVLSTHTRSFWKRLFHYSLAKSVVRRANVPLLIVRHPKPDMVCEESMIDGI